MSRLTSVGSLLFDVFIHSFFLFFSRFSELKGLAKPQLPSTAVPPSDFSPALCDVLLTTTSAQMTFIPSMSWKK